MDDVLRRAPAWPILCRLRAEHEVVVERLALRGSPEFAAASRTYDEDHAVPMGDLTVTTHPHGIAELAREILRQLGPWPPKAQRRLTAKGSPGAAPLDCGAALVAGPRAVGKSTVAWRLYMSSVSAGVRTCYLDLAQLGFVGPPLAPGKQRVELANVAACWDGFRRQGSERLVLCGCVEGLGNLDLYRRLIPSLHVVALTAGYDTILRRASQRTRRKEIWLPGDDLFGRAESDLPPLAEHSAAFTGEGADLVLLTDGLSPKEVASRITRW
jgi:chloramphenicol 3-O-phosphotransferase